MMIGIGTTDIDCSITLNVAGYIAHSVGSRACVQRASNWSVKSEKLSIKIVIISNYYGKN